MSLDIKSTKILVAVLFGLLRFFFGMLPFKLYKIVCQWEGDFNKKRHQQVTCALALFQSFGGGVLFATAFLHMMPEVYFSLEELKRNGNLETPYPLSQLTISCGFFLVYFVEEFSHWFVTKVPDRPIVESKPSSVSGGKNKITPIKKPDVSLIENQQDRKVVPKDEDFIIPLDLKENFESTEIVGENRNNVRKIDDSTSALSDQVTNEVIHKSTQQCARYMLVVAALSLHAIFEGLAIGLQHSISNVWYLFTATSIHSATILFYIGLELVLAKTQLVSMIIHISVLSITCPIGVLLGLAISLGANMNTQAKSLAVILLEGLSAGTILYITFFEVLNREKEKRIYRLRRALCILGGFGLMALLQCMNVH